MVLIKFYYISDTYWFCVVLFWNRLRPSKRGRKARVFLERNEIMRFCNDCHFVKSLEWRDTHIQRELERQRVSAKLCIRIFNLYGITALTGESFKLDKLPLL